MIILNQSINTMQNYATWIQIALSYQNGRCLWRHCKRFEKRFESSNYEINRPLPKGKNTNVIGFIKDELGGKIMVEFVGLRPKTYSYLTDDGNSDKKAKGTKKYVIKRKLKFNNYKNCLLNNEFILNSQQIFKSNAHNVYTEEINKIALSINDDIRLQTFDKITSYSYSANVGKVCKIKQLEYLIQND